MSVPPVPKNQKKKNNNNTNNANNTNNHIAVVPNVNVKKLKNLANVRPDGGPQKNGGKQFKKNNNNGGKKETSWWKQGLNTVADLASKIIPLVSLFGDYKVQTNSLLAEKTMGQQGFEVPTMSNAPLHNIISHREYLGDILSTTSAFTQTRVAIQPGLPASFPWLAPLANSYQQYRLRGMIYEYKSLATNFASTPNIGFVALATQYNSLDPAFTSKLDLENNEFSSSHMTSESFLHPIECAKNQTANSELYVRNGPVSNNGDARLYDHGILTIAVGGQPASGAIIGEMWCTYEVEFLKPKLASALGLNQNQQNITTISGISNAAPLGTSGWTQNGSLPCTVTGTTITPTVGMDGSWFLLIQWMGANGTITFPVVSATNCTVQLAWNAPQSAATTIQSCAIKYALTNFTGLPVITVAGGGSLPASPTSVTIDLWQAFILGIDENDPVLMRGKINPLLSHTIPVNLTGREIVKFIEDKKDSGCVIEEVNELMGMIMKINSNTCLTYEEKEAIKLKLMNTI